MNNTVALSLPADGTYLMVARSVVASIATVEGATVEEVEDLRLATSEACSLLLEDSANQTLSVTVGREHSDLVLTFAGAPTDAASRPGSDLAWMLLSALVDDVQWSPGAQSTVIVRKALLLTVSPEL